MWILHSNAPKLKQKFRNWLLVKQRKFNAIDLNKRLYLLAVIISLIVIVGLTNRSLKKKTQAFIEEKQAPIEIEITTQPIPSYEEAFPTKIEKSRPLPGRKLAPVDLQARERIELDQRLDQGNQSMENAFEEKISAGDSP